MARQSFTFLAPVVPGSRPRRPTDGSAGSPFSHRRRRDAAGLAPAPELDSEQTRARNLRRGPHGENGRGLRGARGAPGGEPPTHI